MRWIRDEGYFERFVMLLIFVTLIVVFAAIEWPSETVATAVLIAMGVFSVVIAPRAAKPMLDRWSRERK